MDTNEDFKICEIECKNPLNKIADNGYLPYRYDLNVYRGCSHACSYCFARYSHGYLGDENFFHSVYVKTNAAEALDRALGGMRKLPDIVNLGGVTDNYQSAEETYRIMPKILKTLIKYRVPALISTKSDLILRDMELIERLNAVAGVNVAVTVTTLNDKIWTKAESGARPPKNRLEVLSVAKQAGATTGLHMMPVMPYLTDTEENLNEVFQAAKEVGVDYLIAEPLNLRGETKTSFTNFLRKEYPSLGALYKVLFQNGSLDKPYRKIMGARIAEAYRKFGVQANYTAPIAKKIASLKQEQLSIFDMIEKE